MRKLIGLFAILMIDRLHRCDSTDVREGQPGDWERDRSVASGIKYNWEVDRCEVRCHERV